MIEQSSASLPAAKPDQRHYYGWAVVVMAVVLGGGTLAMFVDNNTTASGQSQFGLGGTLGVIGYLVAYIALIALSRRSFVSAIAAHRWFKRGQSRASIVLVVFLYVCVVPYVLFFYPFYGLYQYGRGYLDQRRREPLESERHVAELEAQLGIEPKVAGTCPHCGKPLQLDAEFCGFCGQRVIPAVHICSKCGTVSLPGATWCAHCGSSLGENPSV